MRIALATNSMLEPSRMTYIWIIFAKFDAASTRSTWSLSHLQRTLDAAPPVS